MADSSNTEVVSGGFFQDLLHRRVPQIVGLYLGGSWGLLQFFNWVVDRYLLSQLLVDLMLTLIGALLPSIVVLAYCHGAPGKNRWQKSEKTIIPINLILAGLLVFFLFGNKSFDSIGRRVAVTDETGKEIKKVVPSTASIKDLMVFYIKNESEDESLNWLQYGITNMLALDLIQDPFVNTTSPSIQDILKGFYVFQKIKEAGYEDGTGVPLMLEKKIAGELDSKYFLSGSFKREKGELELKATLYRTKDTKIISEKTFKGTNSFAIVDNLSIFIKKSLKLPGYKNDEIVDLPIAGIYTKSEKAARLATSAVMAIIKQNDWETAQKQLEEALKIDESFTIAYSSLANVYAVNNNIEKLKATYKTLMKFLYKLPDKMQYYLKASYYLNVKGEPEKVIALFEMLIKLYPTDISIFFQLASHLDQSGRYDEAVKYYKRILDIDPGRFTLYKDIGLAYENMSDMENALVYYEKYLEKFPQKLDGLLSLGKLLEKNGKLKEAKEYYDRAFLLDPEDISISLLIAGLNIKTGKFPEAQKIYDEALQTAKTARDRYSIYTGLARYCALKGQPSRQLKYTNLRIDSAREYSPPVIVLIYRIFNIKVLIKNGGRAEAVKLLDSLKNKLPSPMDKLLSFGYILVNLDRKDPDKAESYIADLEDFVKKTGGKQILYLIDKSRGDIEKLRGSYEKALVEYRKALKYDLNDVSILNAISFCLRKLNKQNEAVEIIEKALTLSPFDPILNTSAAKIYFEIGKRQESIKRLERAIEVWAEAEPVYKPAQDAKKTLKEYLATAGPGK